MQPQKATHQQTKTYNSQLVLKTIFDHAKISRADVARLTKLTRTTVSEVVAELMERQLVEEVGRGPSAGGKSPILLSVAEDARHLIAIDQANDEYRGAVANLRGVIRHAITLPLEGRSGGEALALVHELIDALLPTTDRPLLGIGIGTPGLLDTGNGVVRRAVNLSWQDLPLGSLLQTRYALPVYVANDCQAAALAEHIFGNGQDARNMVLIKIGHGIGAGIVLDGHLFQGDGFGAGEIGHVTVVEDGLLCRCGNRGCLETIASSRAMAQRTLSLSPQFPSSVLGKRALESQAVTDKMLFGAFLDGDDLAMQVVSEAGKYLGVAAANLVGALNINCILIGGSIVRCGEPLLEVIRKEMVQRSLGLLAREATVKFAALGADVVMLGASALLLTRELGLSLAAR